MQNEAENIVETETAIDEELFDDEFTEDDESAVSNDFFQGASSNSDYPPYWFIELLAGLSPESLSNFEATQRLSAMQMEQPELDPVQATQITAELLSKLLPKKQALSTDVAARAEIVKRREIIRYQKFMKKFHDENPMELKYHAAKARPYSNDDDPDELMESDGTKKLQRMINNQKSLESRHKQKLNRVNNGMTVIYLRERILEYQKRMNMLKTLLKKRETSQ